MDSFRFLLAAALATMASSAACAQTSEAARYTNQQGIEIIQNRPASAAKLPVETAKPRAPEPATVKDARFQVSAKDQAERDRDRLAILRQELLKEMEGYQAKNKILHSSSMQASLTDDQLQRVRDTVHTHAKHPRPELGNQPRSAQQQGKSPTEYAPRGMDKPVSMASTKMSTENMSSPNRKPRAEPACPTRRDVWPSFAP